MNETLRHIVSRLGIVSLAVTLIAAAVGFFYVARLTQSVSGQIGAPSMPLALFVLAGGAALGGFAALRLAIHGPDDAEV